MEQKLIDINGIPAVVFGKKSNKSYIYVHGRCGNKFVAETFAGIAEERGYQTIAFDLPEHGDRHDSKRLDVWDGTSDLTSIAEYVFSRYDEVSLYGCSIGAYFSLVCMADKKLVRCLFQSPIADMKWLVTSMMRWNNVDEERLRREGEIKTPTEPLRYDFYRYIMDNPLPEWKHKTFILCGAKDELQPIESVKAFAKRSGAVLTIAENSGHAFMGEGDSQIVEKWLRENIR